MYSSRHLAQRLLGATMLAGIASAAIAGAASAQSTTPPVNPSATKPTATQPTTPAELGAAILPGAAATTGPADSKPAPQPGQTQTANGELEGVVVTGSRIRRSEYTSADPITVVTAEQATLQGLTDTASLLQTSSVAAGVFQTNTQLTGYVTTGGPGVKTLSIRGLGAQRTLVLLNGHRLGPAGTRGQVGPVDLTVIPEASIERVEILKDGASSIYGSDAVGGVVNIITKQNRDGGSLKATLNGSEHGGGNAYQVSGDFGHKWDRGFVSLSAEYFSQEPLRNRQRYLTSCAEDYLFTADKSTRVDYTTPYANDGHIYKCYNQVNNAISTTAFGTLQYLQPGVVYPTAAQGNNVPATVAGTFARQARAGYPLTYPYANYDNDAFQNATSLSPEQHYSFAVNGGYDLTRDVQLYGEFEYNQRSSEQNGSRQFFPTLTSAWIAGNPNNIFRGTGVTPVYGISPLASNTSQNVHYYRGVAGIKGKFTNLGYLDRFNFDVYGQYSLSDADYKQDIIYNDRVLATTTSALPCTTVGITNISGYSCANAPAAGIPWLSSRVISGAFTPEERAFLFAKEGGHTKYEQYQVEASITGDLFNIWAGPVGGAFGFSYRHDHIDDNPDRDLAQNNLWGQTSAGRTRGSDANKEAYGELDIPLLRNVPFFQKLSLDVSGRYSDYDSYGSNETYKLSLNWQVNDDIRFRASKGTSFRAPALYEQYLANQSGFLGQGSVDACINYQDSANAVLQANCRRAGVPTNYTGVSPNGGGGSAIVYTGGGVGNLSAETSEANTVGFVLTPKFIKPWLDLNLAVDYFDVSVDNQVSQFGAANIVSQCYSRADYPTNVYCTLFNRDTNPTSASYLNILSIQNNYLNVANQRVRGVDASMRLSHDFGDRGRVTLDMDATWRLADKTQVLTTLAPTNYLGSTYNYGGPDATASLRARYDLGPWTVFWATQFIGKGSDTEIFGTDTYASTKYSDVLNGVATRQVYYKQYNEPWTTSDFSVRYNWTRMNAQITGGVKNLFDEDPPISSTGQFRRGMATLNAYDLVGRRFFITLEKKF